MSYWQYLPDSHHRNRLCKTIHSATKKVCYETGTYRNYNIAQPA